MKHFLSILALMVIIINSANCQFIKKPSLELGWCYHSNSLNEDKYLGFKYYYFHDNNLSGLNLKLVFPTEITYLDLTLGCIFEKNTTTYSTDSWTIGKTNSIDYLLNGGGVYCGISPKLKGKYFGLTSEFALGVLCYKEYASVFNNITEPFIDENIRKASYGLGAIGSIGFYLKAGIVMVNPTFQAIFSGGDQTSFLFYGVNLPISISF